jgi:hypothetical protein
MHRRPPNSEVSNGSTPEEIGCVFKSHPTSGIDAVDSSFHRRGSAKVLVADEMTRIRREPHEDDHDNRTRLAKSVFQVHGIDAEGKVAVRKQLKRARVIPFFMKLPLCIVGIEACASSHHWARELTARGTK